MIICTFTFTFLPVLIVSSTCIRRKVIINGIFTAQQCISVRVDDIQQRYRQMVLPKVVTVVFPTRGKNLPAQTMPAIPVINSHQPVIDVFRKGKLFPIKSKRIMHYRATGCTSETDLLNVEAFNRSLSDEHVLKRGN